MQFSLHRNRKGLWRVALALTVAAVAAPVAQATSFEDRAGLAPTASESNEWVKSVTSLSPEALVATFGTGPAPADGSVGTDAFMRAVNNHVSAPQSSPEAEALGRYADSLGGDSTSAIEALRFKPRSAPSPTEAIELVRQSPRGISSPQAIEAGFQWNDAAIGGGFALGLMLLAGAAFLATRHMSRPITV